MIDENSTKEEVLKAVSEDASALYYASNKLINDKDVVTEAVKGDGYALKLASDELRNDKEVVIEAIKFYSFLEQISHG